MAPLLQRFTALLGLISAASAAELTQVTDFGDNPSDAKMYIYVPDNLAPNPAVIVAIHGCFETAPLYFRTTDYASAADASGSFILIYPGANSLQHCFDVASPESLTHGGGGDSLAIVSMVHHTLSTYSADPARVFATGWSSGGMMTNVLAAAYPDVFAAGSAYSGVAAGCLAGSSGSGPIAGDQTCANGEMLKSPAAWGKIARDMFPGYEGPRPKMLVWHGTDDGIVDFANLGQTLGQWSNVFGVEATANNTDTPEAGYTEMVFGDGSLLRGYVAEGVSHFIPKHVAVDLAWFGLA
ncbi:hypothetical protein FQN50_009624 [Emmonsiellopsis sp. PD_5]|nr:hypothetical protein FQN50_009624 [Emmonsiellopsis sp. PD_5]